MHGFSPQCPFCDRRPLSYDVATDLSTCRFCQISFATRPVTTVCYDQQYVAERYDRYETTDQMSRLRLGVLEAVLYLYEGAPYWHEDARRGRLLDVGYGNGSFIRAALKGGWDAYGNDINLTCYPGVCRQPLPICRLPVEERYRAITFFDSLEHFETMDEVRNVVYNTDWIVVSVPCPLPNFPEGAKEWKHFRPGEHHWYFHHPFALEKVFQRQDREARVVFIGHPEDSIRQKLPDGRDNIVTVALRCRDVK